MKIFLLLLPFSLIVSFSTYADVVFKDSKIIDPRAAKILLPQEHFYSGTAAMNEKNWKKASKEFNAITKFHPNSEYVADAYYYMGVSFYNMVEYELANKAFNNYMKKQESPEFFEETLKYKFSIAELFRRGAKRRPFGTRELFKFLSGDQIALTIYDEIIAAMPSHDLAAQSLYSKASLLWKLGEYKESIEFYQTLTRRFPKHELTPLAYLNITKVYLDQSRSEFQNPDIISLAEVNIKKFRNEFPRDEKISLAENVMQDIIEIYAQGLFQTGQFYERTYKLKAAVIYYENTIRQYPETQVAQKAILRLKELSPSIYQAVEQMRLAKESTESSKSFNLDDSGIRNFDFKGISFE